MTNSEHAGSSAGSTSDNVDLDELLKDVKSYSGGDELAIPGFFESDHDHAEFIAWYRAERK